MRLLIFLMFPFSLHAQTVYHGKLVSQTTKQKIGFVTVALQKDNIGTNANENGEFRLVAKSDGADTMTFSCVGFETLSFSTAEFSSGMIVSLIEKQVMLRPVILSGKLKRSLILNEYSDCGFNAYMSTGTITQIAQQFASVSDNSFLSEINICKWREASVFRIRVYDIDTVTGKPGADLLDTLMQVRSSKSNVHLNVESFNIYIPHKIFFIAIEWLFIEGNEKVMEYLKNGRKEKRVRYSPNISMRDPKVKFAEEALINWQMDYRGKWLKAPQVFRFLISAKVKY